jgi:sterol desaturase/sphingolipid hydroxylase (fatty acid hydroxylase superfamily)
MHENAILELLSRVHPAVPLLLYLPLVAYLLYSASVNPALTLAAIVVLFGGGLLVWTLVEYLVHRYVYHIKVRGPVHQHVYHVIHGYHHDYPGDFWHLVMPPHVTIALAVIFYFVFRSIFGEARVGPFFSGFVFGYVFYEAVHFAVHHLPCRKGVLSYLRKHHLRHHFGYEENAFGVTSPLWDYVLGSMPIRRLRRANRNTG